MLGPFLVLVCIRAAYQLRKKYFLAIWDPDDDIEPVFTQRLYNNRCAHLMKHHHEARYACTLSRHSVSRVWLAKCFERHHESVYSWSQAISTKCVKINILLIWGLSRRNIRYVCAKSRYRDSSTRPAVRAPKLFAWEGGVLSKQHQAISQVREIRRRCPSRFWLP